MSLQRGLQTFSGSRTRRHHSSKGFNPRRHPGHLAPVPKSSFTSSAGLSGLVDSLRAAQHVVEMFRRNLPEGSGRRILDRLANRLTKITAEAKTSGPK